MRYIPEEFIDQTASFLRDLRATDTLAIVYHGDPDGCCAAVMLTAAIRKAFNYEPSHYFWVGTHEFTFTSLKDHLVKIAPSHVIFLDLNIESKPEVLYEIVEQTGSRVLIYDDHISTFAPARREILYLNPTTGLGADFPRPACVYAFELLQRLTSIDMRWVAAIGIIAESVSDYYSKFLDQLPVEREMLAEIAKLITPPYLTLDSDKANDQAFSLLLEAAESNNPRLFANLTDDRIRRLHQLQRNVKRAIDNNIRQFSSRARVFASVSLYVFEVRSKYRIANLVASTMKWKLSQSTVLTYQFLPDRVMIEIRTTPDLTTLDLTKVLQKTFSNLPYINMGGHPVAAGAAIDKAHLAAFVRNFRRAMREELAHAA